MAEQVQATLDTMVAPLRDLLDRGIFSDDEIKAIVVRRRASEYLLRRRAARKADFIRYIEDEIKLETLRSLRSRKLMGPDSVPRSQLPIGDVHIVQNIHLLFVRALRKFRADINLHLQHAAFSKAPHSYSRLSTIYTQALQVHPRHVPLWIEAASFEFFGHEYYGKTLGGGSIQAARVLLQRGLRINPTSWDLWLQYFSLELHHVQKLKGRKEILQLSNNANEEAPQLPIPRVLFQNAIKAIPTSVSFRCKFLDLCRLFPQMESLQDDILASVERDFEKQPEAWLARAAHMAEANEIGVKRSKRSYDPVLKLLEQGLDVIPTSEMVLQCLAFVKVYGNDMKNRTHVQHFVDTMFEMCKEKGIQSSQLVLEQSSYLVSHDQTESALKLLKDFCDSNKGATVSVWIRWAQLVENPATILQLSLEQIPMDSTDYKVVLLELFGVLLQNEESDMPRLKNVFETILLLAPGRAIEFQPVFGVESIASACLQYLRHANIKGGLGLVREVVDHVLSRSNYCSSHDGKTEADLLLLVEFFDECVVLEKANQSKGTKHQLRRLYDSAIRLFQGCSPTTTESFRNKLNMDVRFAL